MRATVKHSKAPVREGTEAALRKEVQRLRDHIYSLYMHTKGKFDGKDLCFDPDCDGLCGMYDPETVVHAKSLQEPQPEDLLPKDGRYD